MIKDVAMFSFLNLVNVMTDVHTILERCSRKQWRLRICNCFDKAPMYMEILPLCAVPLGPVSLK